MLILDFFIFLKDQNTKHSYFVIVQKSFGGSIVAIPQLLTI